MTRAERRRYQRAYRARRKAAPIKVSRKIVEGATRSNPTRRVPCYWQEWSKQ